MEIALQVADQLTARDALAAHARDELGILEMTRARPVQAALTPAVVGISLALLLLLGGIAARLGGAIV